MVTFPATQSALLDELTARTADAVRFGEGLADVPGDRLHARPAPKRWSALECLEHANRYADDYLGRLDAAAAKAGPRAEAAYAPTWVGRRFAAAVHPGTRDKKMRTFPTKDPRTDTLDADAVVAAFVANQQAYLDVLGRLADRSLTGVKVGVSILPIVRLRLADMLAVVLWHNARHVEQAREAVG